MEWTEEDIWHDYGEEILGLNGVNASVPADSVLCYVTGGITLVIFLYFCIAKGKQENNPFAV